MPNHTPGDCDGNGSVAVDEVVRGVCVKLASLGLDACCAADVDGDGEVSTSDLVVAVGRALVVPAGAWASIK